MRAPNRFELAYNGLIKTKPLLLLATALCFFATAHGQKSTALVLTQTIAFPNLQGGFNHMSVDSEHHRLFVGAPSNKTLEIVDLTSGKLLQSLPGERPAAARFSLEFNQLYVSGPQGVSIYDGSTLDIITTVNVDSTVDELQYDPGAHELYAGCMTEGQTGIAVIAIPEGKLVGKISLPAKPQGFAVELKGQRIFANVPMMKQIAVMDREKHALLAPWRLKGVEGNTPIGLDEAHHRLLVGGRQTAQLVVLDTLTGKQVAEVAIDGVADDLFYDPMRQRIYISCADGLIDVIEQRVADHYWRIARRPTVQGAATSAFSATLNSFYFGVPRRGDKAAEVRVFKVGN